MLKNKITRTVFRLKIEAILRLLSFINQSYIGGDKVNFFQKVLTAKKNERR